MGKVSWLKGTCIGRGSFGTVNLAADKSDGRIFAVKSVDIKSCLPNQLEALENEIRILKSLSSPYVVEYIGDDITSEHLTCKFRNLHVEYLPGGTVAEFAGADLHETTVQSYTWCIVSALRYVHARGIVHCDVKGRNVLLGSTPGTAKIADFGSAKEVNSAALPRGSPLWMAPEVVRGQYQGPESDVWSLGCTVIEMVTGKPAWDDSGAGTLFQIGYSDELPAIPSQLSETGRDFLEKCLRRDPGERWTCNQLLQHPFVSSCAPPIMPVDWSPKCILDRFDSNFSDEEFDDGNPNSSLNSNLRGRITELATSSGAIWESDGWVGVRNFATEEIFPEACCSGEGGGANSSSSDLLGIEEESTGANLEYSDSKRTKWEYKDTDGCPSLEGPKCKYYGWGGGRKAGSSCRHGFGYSETAVEMEECGCGDNDSCCNLKRLLNYYKDYKCNINVPCVINYLLDSINIFEFLRTCDQCFTFLAVDRNARDGWGF
ncbi:hypothetical protein LguiA_020844 [Lonicera macranthoides]